MATWTLTGRLLGHDERPLANKAITIVCSAGVTVDKAADLTYLYDVRTTTDGTGVLVDPQSGKSGVTLVVSPSAIWTVRLPDGRTGWTTQPAAGAKVDVSDLTYTPVPVTAATLDSIEARLDALEAGGTGGGGGQTIITTSTATITKAGEYVAGTSTTLTMPNGAKVALSKGQFVVVVNISGSLYVSGVGTLTDGGSAPTTPTPPAADTTPPTPGTIAATVVTETGFTVAVTGATDDQALSSGPYAFSIDGGAWTAWQASTTYVASGLTAAKAYSVRHKVRDFAGNEATGAAITVTTAAPSEAWKWVDNFDSVAVNAGITNRALSGGTGVWPAGAGLPAVTAYPSGTDVWGLRGDGSGAVRGESAAAKAGHSIDTGSIPMRARILFSVPADAAAGDLVRVGVSTRANATGNTADFERRGVWVEYVVGTGVLFRHANYSTITTAATYTGAGTGALSGTLTVEYNGSTAKAWYNDTLVGSVNITGLDGTLFSIAASGNKATIDQVWARNL